MAGDWRGWLRTGIQAVFFIATVTPFMTPFIALRLRGRDNLPKNDFFLLIANHSSHSDTLALLSLFPVARLRHIRPVAAADTFVHMQVLAMASRALFNVLPIDRRGERLRGDPIQAMVRVIDGGPSLILLPEDTRGSSGEVARSHSGVAALLEAVPGLCVNPAYLRDLDRSLPKGTVLPVPLFAEVVLGRPLRPPEPDGRSQRLCTRRSPRWSRLGGSRRCDRAGSTWPGQRAADGRPETGAPAPNRL